MTRSGFPVTGSYLGRARQSCGEERETVPRHPVCSTGRHPALPVLNVRPEDDHHAENPQDQTKDVGQLIPDKMVRFLILCLEKYGFLVRLSMSSW